MKITKQLIVPYSATQMYVLVNDIEKYPEFLDWCHDATILTQNNTEIMAELVLGYNAVTQRFTTRNKLERYNNINKITMSLVDGPFKYLNGVWQFTDINQSGSKVELMMEFEFSNYFMSMAFSKVFQNIAEQLVDKFYQRARLIYK